MHPEIMALLVRQRMEDQFRTAETSRRVREARRVEPVRRDANVTLRVDRVGDSARLYQLAALNDRRLPAGPFVLAEVDGRPVAALPILGGVPLADPFVPTAHLLPLLELRAEQIRGVELRPQGLRRLLPRRAA